MKRTASVCLLGLLATASASYASTITFTASNASGPLSASASVTTSAGQVQVTLTNTLAANLFVSAGQAVSDFSFTLSNGPGSLGATSATGQLGNISGAQGAAIATVTYVNGAPTRFLGTNPGSFGISGNTVTLETIGGGQPSQMIAPFVANGGQYVNGNNGLQQFIPYTIGSATFTLNLTGVTAATTVTGTQFSFGTSPDTFINGTPSTPPPVATPEPSSLMLLGTGVLACAGLVRRRIG